MSDRHDSERRRLAALAALTQASGTEAGEGSVDLFISHHLEEMPPAYWQQHLGTSTPGPAAVLSLLTLRSSWGRDELEYFDFTLPGDVTQYVVSVHFDESGVVDDLSMES